MYGDRIKELIYEAKITAAQVADNLGWTRQYFNQITTDKTTPSADKLVSIANYFTNLLNRKVNLYWFLTGEGTMFIEQPESDDNILSIKLKRGQTLKVTYED